jgi:hypothetical protein
LVSTAQRREGPCALALVDDGPRTAQPDEQQVDDQATRPSVAVEDRMDLLEAGVQVGERFDERRCVRVDQPPPGTG